MRKKGCCSQQVSKHWKGKVKGSANAKIVPIKSMVFLTEPQNLVTDLPSNPKNIETPNPPPSVLTGNTCELNILTFRRIY